MSRNYPPGADTVRAPWNQPGPEECRLCQGKGGLIRCDECEQAIPSDTRHGRLPSTWHPCISASHYEPCGECGGVGERYYDEEGHGGTCMCRQCDPDTYLHAMWEGSNV